MPTLTKAPSPKDFASAWTRGFAAAVRSEAGKDGRLSRKEAERIAEQGGALAQFGDNAVNYLEHTGQKSVSVDKLIGKAHDYAFAVAEKAAGSNQRLSLVEAKNLPEDLRGDFFALRGKEDPGADEPNKLTGARLNSALDQAATTGSGFTIDYISEGDYPVLASNAANPENLPVNGASVMALFEDTLTDGIFEDVDDYSAELTSETWTKAESKQWLKDLGTVDPDDDSYYTEMREGFGRIKGVVDDNLSDVRVVKIGPKDDDGSLAVDSGTYAYFIVGKTDNGEIAGVHFGSAET